MLHTSAQDRYEKLKRVFARLMHGRFSRDDLDDFILTANSLREWIEQDASLIPKQKDHIRRFTVPQSLDWQICNQIANVQKHARTNRHGRKKTRTFVQSSSPSVITVLDVKPGAGVGFYETESGRIIGAGDEIILGIDGRPESALAFVVRAFRHFHYIFEIAPVPVDKRTLPEMSDIFKIR